MQKSPTSPGLITVCGLPGARKTPIARRLEEKLGALRFCPNEWMDALSLNLYDEARRANIEALQWKFGQSLLARGLKVIIEWGTWGRSEHDVLRRGAKAFGAALELHYLSAPIDVLLERIERRGMENPPLAKDELAG